jgi:hypothetical protein
MDGNMTFRQKIARSLRKWADLIDPRIGPREPLLMTIEVDAAEAEVTLARLKATLEELAAAKRRCD